MSKIVHHHLRTVTSTIPLAKEFVKQFDPSKIILISAEEQTEGRGRLKSQWMSPASVNVYATFCHGFDPERYDCCNLAQVMAVCVGNVLCRQGIGVSLKWPNDLMVNKCKIVGIICEIKMLEGNLWVFNSVGLNVNMTAEDMKDIPKPATSMIVETGKQQDIKVIIEEIKDSYEGYLSRFIEKGFGSITDELNQLTQAYQEKPITFRDSHQVHEGIFKGLDANGALLLEVEGNLETFHAGSIEY